jgi:predicted MFS family arabinose efflux permease
LDATKANETSNLTPREEFLNPPTAARYSISAVFFVFGALVGAWIPHIPDVKHALNIPNTILGFALLASGCGALCVMPVTGAIVHRFGSKHVSIASGFAAALLVPWLALEKSTAGLAVNLFAVGLCYGCLDVSMNAHSVAVQARHDRPILSAVHGCFSIGGFAGSAGAALAAKLSLGTFPHLCVNSAVLMALLAVSARFLLPAEVDKDTEGPKFVIPHGVLLLLGALCMFAYVVEGGLLDWTALYLRSTLRSTAELGAIGTAAINFAMAISRFGGDRVVAAAGYRYVLIGSGVMAAAGIFVGVVVTDPLVAIACFSVSALGTANMVPILFAEGGTVEGYSAGTGLAAIATFGYAGFLLGPPALGYVADLRSLGFAIGLLGILGLLVSLLAKRAVPA